MRDDTTARPRQPFPDHQRFVVAGVVEEDMDAARSLRSALLRKLASVFTPPIESIAPIRSNVFGSRWNRV